MPSISITPRAAKCRIDSFSRAGQLVLMQRLAASPSSRTIFAAADRAMLAACGTAAGRALRLHAHHFRNHVAAALDQHRVADLHAQPLDFVFVVQRGARHRDAAHLHRLQMRHRRQRAGAAHLHFDVLDHGLRLPRGILDTRWPSAALWRSSPARCCCATESTFTTTPSISYGRSSRFASHSRQNASSSSTLSHMLAAADSP